MNAAKVARFGRYRIEPLAGDRYLSPSAEAAVKPDYLHDEMPARLAAGPVRFRLMVQLAGPGDIVTDPSTARPDQRPMVVLGTLSLTAMMDSASPEAKALFFNPMNLVPGIAPSDDPLLAARARSYTTSYRRRLAGQ